MKDKVISSFDNKKYKFSTYFLIRDGRLLEISDFNFHEKIENCYYVKKLGSNIYPEIYCDIKINNRWGYKNKYIGNYKDLMNFIQSNNDTFICIRGFSRANMFRFIRLFNEFFNTDIKIVRFNRSITETSYDNECLKREERINKVKSRIKNKK